MRRCIEVVVTRTIRNRFVLSRARGFESHHLRQIINAPRLREGIYYLAEMPRIELFCLWQKSSLRKPPVDNGRTAVSRAARIFRKPPTSGSKNPCGAEYPMSLLSLRFLLTKKIVFYRRVYAALSSKLFLDSCAWIYYNNIRYGLVAQLGERRVRNAEVEGSIPFESTK